MLQFSTILFPMNSAARCVATAPYVSALADQFQSRVVPLHVSADSAAIALETSFIARIRRMIGAERTRHLTRIGDPVEEIERVAREEAADLLVMATRGFSRIRRLWNPSVTAGVLERVSCPVITCTDEWRRWANRDINTVLCATALGPESERALQWASQLAKSIAAELAVIHADARLQTTPGYPYDGEWKLFIRQSVREELKRTLRDAGAEGADLWIEGDNPAVAIAEVADQLQGRSCSPRAEPRLRIAGRSTCEML